MIRFFILRELYMFELYKETYTRNGEFRFQAHYNPVPDIDVTQGLREKCLLGLIAKGYVEFRQDRGGASDGYEITAAGIELVEDQLLETENTARADTNLERALAFRATLATPAAAETDQASGQTPSQENGADNA